MTLKPCPICGGEAEIEREGTNRQSCIVSCTQCGCQLESNEIGAGYHWNMRVTPCPGPDGVRCMCGCGLTIGIRASQRFPNTITVHRFPEPISMNIESRDYRLVESDDE